MKNQTRTIMFLMTILTVFTISALWTLPAFADDEAPPPVPTSEPVQPPEEVPPPSDTAVAETLAQIPEGTEIVVTNAEGEAIPFATQEAADALVTGDPVWCPTGVAPQNGAGGCTDSYTTLYGLTNDIATGAITAPGANGVIWIKFGADTSANPIIINGFDTDLNTWENFSLTLKGGWNGTFGSTTTNSATPSTFTKSISIINWLGDITLSDITISGVTVGSATNSAALDIETTKKITLTNVKVNTNTGAGTVNGAYLDNADADPLIFGDVSITNSQFNDNKNRGLQVFSEGMITLANVLVNRNDAGGATLDNQTAVTAKAVTIITGTNEFSNNTGIGNGDGLNIASKGIISLKDITASNNGGDGIHLDNRPGSFVSSIIFTGATIAADNGLDGIEAYSDGAITASNLVANSNGGRGTFLDNHDAATALGVTLSGSSNQFKFNGGDGLKIYSDGAITLNSIAANNNVGNGAILDNDDLSPGLANVTLTGTNSFKENRLGGLTISSDGMVTISNVTANDNGIVNSSGYGVNVDNSGASTPKAVTLTGTNQLNGNYSGGLKVISKGTITISNLTASFNFNKGVSLDNTASGTALPQNVTITGTSNTNNNTSAGLDVGTYGTISIGSITANGNGGSGVSLNNSGGTTPKAVTLTGYVHAYGNGDGNDYGLYIHSLGAIKINALDASYNNGSGAWLDNNDAGAVSGITLSGSNDFNFNTGYGLLGESRGVILINDLDASGNTAGFGADLDNTSAATPLAVTLTNVTTSTSVFADNGTTGLQILTKGAVTITNLLASGNGTRGAYIRNTYSGASSPQNVTLNGYGQFNSNGDEGLIVATYGMIVTNNLTANDNGQNGGSVGFGVWLDNCDYNGSDCNALTAKSVTMNGTNTFNNNHLDGLLVQSLGVIKGNNLTASNNDRNGAVLNNGWLFGYIGVTLTGSNVFENNGVDGLDIGTNGVVSLNNVSANGNVTGNGLYINAHNDDTPSGRNGPPNITMTGVNTFNDNGGKGLWILSNGLVTLNNVTANGNGGEGAYINNFIDAPNRWTPSPANTINLLGINNFNGNVLDGLFLYTYGGINISKITADNNGGDGVEGYSVEKGITITCGSMTNNTGVGWRLGAWTTITLKGVFTTGNTVGPFVNVAGTLVTVRTCP